MAVWVIPSVAGCLYVLAAAQTSGLLHRASRLLVQEVAFNCKLDQAQGLEMLVLPVFLG
jgi:hypothetical protein